jgi:DNA-binding transcriptional MerR regulator
MSQDFLTIGELGRATGVATSALRYYEEIGLLPPASRVAGQRRYRPTAVWVVGAILFLRDVGFALGEIKQLMVARAKAPGAWRDLARRKLDELDARIHEAQVARIAVEHAINCPREDIVTCPKFQEVVRQRLAGRPLAEVTP